MLSTLLVRPDHRLTHSGSRRGAGWGVIKLKHVERRQRAYVQRGDEGGAPGVGDLGVAEVERLELLQPSIQPAAARR